MAPNFVLKPGHPCGRKLDYRVQHYMKLCWVIWFPLFCPTYSLQVQPAVDVFSKKDVCLVVVLQTIIVKRKVFLCCVGACCSPLNVTVCQLK
jgi:hypothetical protein